MVLCANMSSITNIKKPYVRGRSGLCCFRMRSPHRIAVLACCGGLKFHPSRRTSTVWTAPNKRATRNFIILTAIYDTHEIHDMHETPLIHDPLDIADADMKYPKIASLHLASPGAGYCKYAYLTGCVIARLWQKVPRMYARLWVN